MTLPSFVPLPPLESLYGLPWWLGHTINSKVLLNFVLIPPDKAAVKEKGKYSGRAGDIYPDSKCLRLKITLMVHEPGVLIMPGYPQGAWAPPFLSSYGPTYGVSLGNSSLWSSNGFYTTVNRGKMYSEGIPYYDPQGTLGPASAYISSDYVDKEINCIAYCALPWGDNVARDYWVFGSSGDWYAGYDPLKGDPQLFIPRDIGIMPQLLRDKPPSNELAQRAGVLTVIPASHILVLDIYEEMDRARAKLQEAFNKIKDPVGLISQMNQLITTMVQAKVINPPVFKYLNKQAPDVTAAGEIFNATHNITNYGGPGTGFMDINQERVPLSSPKQYDFKSIVETLEMPFDDLLKSYDISLFADIKPCVEITKIELEGDEYQAISLPSLLTDFTKFNMPVKAGFPDARLALGILPKLVPAGDKYGFDIALQNVGFKGSIKGLISSSPETAIEPIKLEPNQQSKVSLSFDMPYDDVVHSITAQVLGRNQKWTITDKQDINIIAGFAQARLAETRSPKYAMPGKALTCEAVILNDGSRGEIGCRVLDKSSNKTLEQLIRIDPGLSITGKYEAEMPPLSKMGVSFKPLSLGRNRQIMVGAESVAEIKPEYCLLQDEASMTIYGGSEPFLVKGFMAGINLYGLDVEEIAEIGKLFPLPYVGPFFQMTIKQYQVKTITFDKLHFVRLESDKDIAAARQGVLSSRGTRTYEWSVVPTPLMVMGNILGVGVRLTRRSERLSLV